MALWKVKTTGLWLSFLLPKQTTHTRPLSHNSAAISREGKITAVLGATLLSRRVAVEAGVGKGLVKGPYEHVIFEEEMCTNR